MKNKMKLNNAKFIITILFMISLFSIVLAADVKTYDFFVNENIEIDKWTIQSTYISHPIGITFLDGFLYVTDKKANNIVVLDNKGNFQHKSLESELFLIDPTIIDTDGKLLYIVDSGNNQLKILTKNFEIIQSINLPTLTPGVEYWDLEVIDDKIYLSSNSLLEENAVIYKLDKTGSVKRIGKEFIGYISDYKGKLMAVNSFEYYKGENEDGHLVEGGVTGINSLFKVINDGSLKQIFKYVDNYIPLDFLCTDKYYYVFSAAFAHLDKYTLDGQYLETVIKFDESDLFIQLEVVDNSILIAYPIKKTIYKINLE